MQSSLQVGPNKHEAHGFNAPRLNLSGLIDWGPHVNTHVKICLLHLSWLASSGQGSILSPCRNVHAMSIKACKPVVVLLVLSTELACATV